MYSLRSLDMCDEKVHVAWWSSCGYNGRFGGFDCDFRGAGLIMISMISTYAIQSSRSYIFLHGMKNIGVQLG